MAVALLNEEAVVDELLERILRTLDALPNGPHEVVLVDDGSTDRTPLLLAAAAQRDSRIVVVSFSRNFGHQAALTAALDEATGDVVVVMDADLQDSPETIPRFLEEYRAGFDVVYAIRTDRKEGWWKRTGYGLFYRLIAAISDVSPPVGAGDFGLMTRRVVDVLRQSPERHRYLRGLRTWAGFPQVGIPVERAVRRAGQSKYGLVKLAQLAFDGVFAFSNLPLRLATVIGLVSLMGSIAYAAYAVVGKLFLERPPQGFTTLIVAIIFLSGVQLVFLGIIGEYIGRIYDEAKRRPTYVVKQVLRHTDKDS